MLVFFKKLIVSFVFDFLWTQLIKFVEIEVKETENDYDDELVAWFNSKKLAFEEFVKTVW
jgi:hypothetical protein